MFTKLENLSQSTREVVKWLSSRFADTAKWPSQTETIIFCRRKGVTYDEVIRDDARAVEENPRSCARRPPAYSCAHLRHP